MTDPEELEDDLFADLYDGDDAAPKADPVSEQGFEPEPHHGPPPPEPPTAPDPIKPEHDAQDEPMENIGFDGDGGVDWNANQMNGAAPYGHSRQVENEPRPIGIKEDGKMFIGGLNWETTDESLKDYFSQFGEVQECTVMRDGATGRSRGFGFLTFRDPKTVNIVMVKEHYLDGKIIDPKRAIPRDEQERTSKIFVGGVSQEANEQIFKDYFAQYGRVVDATLMMDKDTGRPRGFGFVTFDSEAAVENTLNGDLMILGKPIEVKKAQPRGDMQEGGGDSLGRGGRGGRGGRRNYDDRYNDNNMAGSGGGNMMHGGPPNGQNNMTPQMMAQYWQKMQQYFASMQQQMAAMAGGGMGMGGMNPAMMQQMQQMQAMQQMKAMQMAQQQGGGQPQQGQGSASPMPPQSPSNGQNGGQGMQGMNAQMMQQMQAMMQQQMQGAGGNFNQGGSGRNSTPGAFSAQEQLAFEQRKYEEQASRQGQGGNYGAQTSWEGMYDDVPPPEGGGGGYGGQGGGYGHARYGGRGRGRGRGGGGGEARTVTPQSAPPANAPTGPKNAGRPGANYRGGGRGSHRGFHPYAR